MSVFEVGDVVRSAYLPPFGDFRALLGPAAAGPDELGKSRDGETVCRVETRGTTLVEEGPEHEGFRGVGSLQIKLARLAL